MWRAEEEVFDGRVANCAEHAIGGGGKGSSGSREFRSGKIAGGWETPPLDVQLADAGGRVLAATGLLKPLKNIAGSYDLGPLNLVLKAAGQQPVSA